MRRDYCAYSSRHAQVYLRLCHVYNVCIKSLQLCSSDAFETTGDSTGTVSFCIECAWKAVATCFARDGNHGSLHELPELPKMQHMVGIMARGECT
jgi:hypothetical protein